jgi:beta-galactosidase
MLIKHSPYSVTETADRLQKILNSKGMHIFAIVDHSGGAHKVHMELREEKVFIFGDPKIGTFLMQENPLIGIELPLKILIWQDGQNLTQVGYTNPLSFIDEYGIMKNAQFLLKMSDGLAQIVSEVIE